LLPEKNLSNIKQHDSLQNQNAVSGLTTITDESLEQGAWNFKRTAINVPAHYTWNTFIRPLLSSGMLRRAVWQKQTGVSDEFTASIITPYIAPCPRRQPSSFSWPWEPEVLTYVYTCNYIYDEYEKLWGYFWQINAVETHIIGNYIQKWLIKLYNY
jgi:hypothetical protein